jgi:hypothetical protein
MQVFGLAQPFDLLILRLEAYFCCPASDGGAIRSDGIVTIANSGEQELKEMD